MSMKLKWIAIAGGACIVIGGVALCVGLAPYGFSYRKYNERNYTAKTYLNAESEAIGALNHLNVSLISQGCNLYFTDRSEIEIRYYEITGYTYTISLEENTLTLEETGKGAFGFFGNGYGTSVKTTDIYLPSGQFDQYDVDITVGSGTFVFPETEEVTSLQLKNTTGSLYVEGIRGNTDALFDVTTGEVKVSNCAFRTLAASVITGTLRLSETQASESIVGKVTTGDIHPSRISSDRYDMSVTTGSIKGTVYGNPEEYSITVSKVTGTCNLSDRTVAGEKYLKANVVTGSIDIEFLRI